MPAAASLCAGAQKPAVDEAPGLTVAQSWVDAELEKIAARRTARARLAALPQVQPGVSGLDASQRSMLELMLAERAATLEGERVAKRGKQAEP